MKSQLKQLFFVSLFCFLCTAFIFFVPWGSSSSGEVSEEPVQQEVDNDEIFSQTNNNQEVIKFTGTLKIAIKEGMLNDDLRTFVNNYKNVHGGNVEFIEVDSPEKWGSLTGVDLYLFPYDQLTGVRFGSINFQEDISTLFIPQLKDFIKKNGNIIPFGIDVPVMYGFNNLGDGIDGLVLSARNWKPARPHGPFNFGISDNAAVYDNSLISSHQIVDFIKVNDVGAFSQWVDFSPASQELKKGLLSSIQGSSDVCKKHPLSCLLEKNLLGVAWGFLSDYDDGFEGKLVVSEYPYELEFQFVRLYALAMSENPGDSAMAFQFILDYMDYAFSDGTTSLAKTFGLAPVFQNEYSSLCYQDACGVGFNIDILEDGFSLINKFYNDLVFRRVIEKKIQPNLYLVNTLL